MRRSISPCLRQVGNLVPTLGARREIGEDVVEGGSAKGGAVVAPAADQRDVDAKVFVGPLHKRFVKIDGRVGKGGEDENLFIWFAELVRGGLGNLGGDEFLELLQFRVSLRADILERR